MGRSTPPRQLSPAFGRLLRMLLLIFLASLILLGAFRLVQLLALTRNALTSEQTGDLARAFWMGLRFDAKVLSILYLPLGFLLAATVPLKPTTHATWTTSVARWWGFVVMTFLLILGVIDLFYIQFFQEHLNITAFGIIDDDTSAVLRSVWTDFPVLRIALGLAIAIFLLFMLMRRIARVHGRTFGLGSRIGLAVALIAAFLGLARGTLGDRPLGDGHSVVSNNALINQLPMNAPMAAQYAIKKYRIARNDEDLPSILRRNGFASISEAVSAYVGYPVTETNALEALVDSVPSSDSALARAHVVFLQMESLGSYYMHFDHGDFDLLGAFGPELNGLLWYPNFVSAAGGTMISMEGILFGSPFRNISQTGRAHIPLAYSAQRTFQRAGYETWYITGQRLGWQNLFTFFSQQGFDHLEGDVELAKFAPHAPTGEWGVHDEAMFERILNVLDSAQTPQFIYGMSISHHTPYDVPQGEFASRMVIPDSVTAIIRCAPDVARRNFIAFRYACDWLGHFLHRLRSSPQAQNTIVAITGDHTLKQTLNFGEQPLARYGVPLFLYIPEAYRRNATADTTLFASHHDIFPTLYHLTLPGARYLKVGGNLLSKERAEQPHAAVYSNTFALTQYDFVEWGTQFYATCDSVTGQMTRNISPTPRQHTLIRWANAREAALAAFLMKEWQERDYIEGLLKR